MIAPALAGKALLDDISAAPSDPGTVSLWWLGQSGFLLKWQENHLLVDPYLSDSLTRKYVGTATEHVRLTKRCVAPEDLGGVTLALSSHAHTDHLDAETLTGVAQASQKRGRRLRLVLSPANLPVAREKLGDAPIDFVPLKTGADLEIDGISLHALPSAHTELKRDAAGDDFFLGFVLRLGPWSIYHSGDTVLYPDLEKHLRAQHPQVLLLPINGHHTERGVAGNLNGTEAAELAHAVGAALVIPCHYDMFAFNTATPDEFIRACEKRRQPYRILRCGERLELSGPLS